MFMEQIDRKAGITTALLSPRRAKQGTYALPRGA